MEIQKSIKHDSQNVDHELLTRVNTVQTAVSISN
jgi:hypothetical protein